MERCLDLDVFQACAVKPGEISRLLWPIGRSRHCVWRCQSVQSAAPGPFVRYGTYLWNIPLTFGQGINHKHEPRVGMGKWTISHSGMMPYRPYRFRPGIKLHRISPRTGERTVTRLACRSDAACGLAQSPQDDPMGEIHRLGSGNRPANCIAHGDKKCRRCQQNRLRQRRRQAFATA